MTKGFKDSKKKFHPTEKRNKSSLKKSDMKRVSPMEARNKVLEKQGFKQRNKQSMSNEIDISRHNWGLEIVDGKIEQVRLGNWVDAGWNWSLDGEDARDSANMFLIRLAKSKVQDEFIGEMKNNGIEFEVFKKQILENLSGELKDDEKSDDGLWALTGDNGQWKFGGNDDDFWISAKDSFFDDKDYSDEDVEKIMDEAYMSDTGYSYGDWLEQHGKNLRDDIIDSVKSSNTFEEYFDEINNESLQQGILENVLIEGVEGHAFGVIAEAESKLKKEGTVKEQSD